jgi:hypothetical protein
MILELPTSFNFNRFIDMFFYLDFFEKFPQMEIRKFIKYFFDDVGNNVIQHLSDASFFQSLFGEIEERSIDKEKHPHLKKRFF